MIATTEICLFLIVPSLAPLQEEPADSKLDKPVALRTRRGKPASQPVRTSDGEPGVHSLDTPKDR